MNYEQDIQIDESALDVEWLEQARKMMVYTRKQAETQRDEELAREAYELLEAELDKKIRTSPSQYGIEKITESAVKSAIATDEEYIEAKQAHIEAKFQNNIAKGAVKAFEQRKEALENLVRLNGQNYFAGPKVPRDLSWEREQKVSSSNKTVASKMQRRAK